MGTGLINGFSVYDDLGTYFVPSLRPPSHLKRAACSTGPSHPDLFTSGRGSRRRCCPGSPVVLAAREL